MKLPQSLFLLCFTSLAITPALAATNGPAAFLRKMDRQLCANFKNLKCSARKRKPSTPPIAKSTPSKPLIVAPIKPVAAMPSKAAVTPQPIPNRKIVPAVIPPEKPVQTALPPIVIDVAPHSDAACIAVLNAKGVDVAAVAQPAGMPSCNVANPVQLKSVHVSGVTLQLPDQPILNCAFAVHFVDWLQELGGPAAVETEGTALTRFYTGPGYQCRGRNGDTSSKISEHGFGNAIDVERMMFSDGSVFLVFDALDTTAPAYDTLKAIRASACKRFTTVLGPGANEAHRSHFHFDSGVHGKSGTYKICE